MSDTKKLFAAAVISAVLLAGCGEDEPPSRDYYPVIQQQVFALQEAVKDRNRASIDSLSTVQLLVNGLSSDSLLRFVYGPDGSFAFETFGNVAIVYTDERARIDCFIMDSTRQTDRPATLTLAHEDSLWLLEEFEITRDTVESRPME